MPDREEVIKGLQIERECVSRNCDRDCGKCDLVQDRDWLLSIYDDALALLKEQNNCENCAITIEDRQPVVLCKDCKYCVYPKTENFCKMGHLHGNTETWFCADGERLEASNTMDKIVVKELLF